MTYLHGGEQYIALAVSARGKPAEIIALKLGDGVDDPGVATASAMPPGASVARAAQINASPEELALARVAYGRTCAACHGAYGQGLDGGAAPPINNQTDIANIRRVVSQGQGEMQSMAALLKPEEIEAIAKFVASGLPRPAGRGADADG
jgi:mono/diheme cytochrome c family protein